MNRPIAILGPTGSGKSNLALQVAKSVSGEIVNCDSIQVYRGFDIGAAKPSAEDFQLVPHHLYNIIDGNEDFDAGRYATLAKEILSELESRAKTPIIVGGTGLYFRALVEDNFHSNLPSDQSLRERIAGFTSGRIRQLLERLDPLRAKELHVNDRYRNERALELRILRKAPMSTAKAVAPKKTMDPFVVIIEPSRAILRERIKLRSEQMFDAGLLQEVQNLLNSGVSRDAKPMQSIGYKEAVAHLEGKLTLAQAKEAVFIASCQYAKRQGTWFRKVQRHITVEDASEFEKVLDCWNERKTEK